MPDPLTPAWIASRLTEAQRAALLWLPERDWEVRRGDGGAHHEALVEMHQFVLAPYIYADLVAEIGGNTGGWIWRATQLGLRVRAVVAGGVDG